MFKRAFYYTVKEEVDDQRKEREREKRTMQKKIMFKQRPKKKSVSLWVKGKDGSNEKTKIYILERKINP